MSAVLTGAPMNLGLLQWVHVQTCTLFDKGIFLLMVVVCELNYEILQTIDLLLFIVSFN